MQQAVQMAQDVALGKLSGQTVQVGTNETGQLLAALSDMQAVLTRFQVAQTEMATQHDQGKISFAMVADGLPGSYGELATAVNAMVQAHIQMNTRAVDLVALYAEGQFDQCMQDLPGEKRRVSDVVNAVRAKLQAASEAAVF